MIVFAEGANLGDDAAISEQKRVLALLDLPRPEMIINGWVLQNSTKRADQFGAANQVIRQTVNDHNTGLQRGVLTGWEYLKLAMADQGYFDPPFYKYLTGMTVLDNADYRDPFESSKPFAGLRQKIFMAQSVRAYDAPGQNVCLVGEYCLGYTTLFQPLQPRLTNLLLAIIAAENPARVTNCAINRIEDVEDAAGTQCGPPRIQEGMQVWAQNRQARITLRRADKKIKTGLAQEQDLTGQTARALQLVGQVNDPDLRLDRVRDCETADQIGIVRQEIYAQNDSGRHPSPDLYLECFRRAATLLLHRTGPQDTQPSELGLARRAIADFLFHYKMSQQYPHEFTPYDLTQSADAFNSALNPLIDAFNHDLTAYQSYLRAKLRTALTAKGIANKDSFLNDGIVSVRTVSGHTAEVDTTSQSFLDASSAPDWSTVAGAVAGALGGGSGNGGGKSGQGGSSGSSGGGGTATASKAASTAAAVATGGLSAEAQAVLAGLSTYQTTKINIGRNLNLSVTPRSTVGASGAEMDVRLTAAESADPKYWSSANQNTSDPDLSRVATHSVNTHVRVDSIVLFDLSSFSAVLAKGRPLLPLLPPFVELPYIGTLAGIPLHAAKEYHSSSAIVSAIAVPTAADLAFGIRFVSDRVLDSEGQDCHWAYSRGTQNVYEQHYCKARTAQSLRDLADQPIREFHHRKIQCFATNESSSVPNNDAVAAKCNGLQFADVLHTAH